MSIRNCSRGDIIWYSVWSLIISAFFITGVVLSVTAYQDDTEYKYVGNITNIYCTEECYWSCMTKYNIVINYTINDISYNETYSSKYFYGCDYPTYPIKKRDVTKVDNIESYICTDYCYDLIGHEIYLDIYDKEPNKIKSASVIKNYNKGYHITVAIFMFIFVIALTGACISVSRARRAAKYYPID